MQVVGNYNVTDRFTGVLNSNFCGENAGSCSSYGYDDAGQRMYKMQLSNFTSRTNALGGNVLQADKLMLYPNGYINITQDGNYTKHYYADAARIASKIGSGYNDSISYNADIQQTTIAFETMKAELGIYLTGDTIDNIIYDFDTITHLIGDGNYEDALYFYHGNHLSSTQLVTDISGSVQQAVLYTPFGQVISEYRQDWMLDTIPVYGFNGKPHDEESGLIDYGARLHDPKGCTFISRDKLFEKFFFTSPYAYCFNNPINLIDPDGRAPWDALVSNYSGKTPNPPTPARLHPLDNVIKAHHGIDMSAPKGTSVNSAANGKVVFAGVRKGYGNVVVIDHGKGYYTLYAHLDNIGVKVDDEVKNGKSIGTVGNTGHSGGNHLHVEYIKTDDSNIEKIIGGNNKNSTRFNPMAIEDLQDIIDGNEHKFVQFLDGQCKWLSEVELKQTFIGQGRDPKFSEKLMNSKYNVIYKLGKKLEDWGF